MANELTPGSTSGGYLTKQNWKRRILGALYETMDALPNFEEIGRASCRERV